jgi:4-oxalocrotonate tautomerase
VRKQGDEGIGLIEESREVYMPYVNIKITREGATADQKASLIQGVTTMLKEVLGKDPQTTVVVIEEVDTDNWGIGGESITLRRKRARTSREGL